VIDPTATGWCGLSEPEEPPLLAGRYRPVGPPTSLAGVARALASDAETEALVEVATFQRDGAVPPAFAETAAAYAAVHHPALALLLAWSDPRDDATMPAIVVESHHDGPRLADVALLDRETTLRAVADVADALAALHAAGLVHGSLAGESVVLAGSGQAIVRGQGAALLQAAALGTTASASAADDLRALGALLYVRLTGAEPGDGAIIAPIVTDPTLDASLNGLTMALLTTDPSRPPPPAAAVGLRLRALASDDVTALGPPPAGRQRLVVAPWVSRLLPRGEFGLVSAAAVIALAGVAVSFAVARGEGTSATGGISVRTVTVIRTHGGIPTPPVTQYLTQTITEPGQGATVTLGGGTVTTFPGTTVYTFRLIPTTIANAGATTLNIPLTVTLPPR
jgi:hypothetical protein